ncbi:hypothetical protein EDB19DRAFT_1910040 [Suillus lakei]|nr:hypothetical protein EDB19DRAFT_1910040 [Suillus lakei]
MNDLPHFKLITLASSRGFKTGRPISGHGYGSDESGSDYEDTMRKSFGYAQPFGDPERQCTHSGQCSGIGAQGYYGARAKLSPGLRGCSDEEKRFIGITTIFVVAHLVLKFHAAGQEEDPKLMISMLLQRLQTSEPTLEAAITYNLVDLALVASEESFIDVARAFLVINCAMNLEDPRFSNNMRVLAAQTRLAWELDQRPDLYDVYLVRLLTLFGDKGVVVQNVAMPNRQVKFIIAYAANL